jgi:hypothetical protein
MRLTLIKIGFWLSAILSLFFSVTANAQKARTVLCSDENEEKIYLSLGRNTILNFPARPLDSVHGNRGLFASTYKQNDLILSPLQSGAKTNLSVYLESRRCNFDLVTVASGADSEVKVRDGKTMRIKVRIKRDE